jgi:2-polyprenyl-6-methoxyphenol hydroxylase-like FAD-dependent oxidoreductase
MRTVGAEQNYDAIVVGARAAGAATGMLLARAGWRVLLVDRSQYGADTLSTHALMRGGVMQLQRWGLLGEIRDAGTPAVRRTNFHYGDHVVPIGIRELHGVDALYAPRRTVLDSILVDAAWDAGVEIVYGARVTGLRRAADGRVGGIAVETEGAEAIADARIVIGADGAGSKIARLVEAPNGYARRDAGALIYNYFSGLTDDLYDFFFVPGTAAGVIPTNDGLANVFVGLPPARLAVEGRRDGVDAVFRAVLREAAPEIAAMLDGVAPETRFRSFAGLPGHLRRARGPGWALVGDAGYFKDPITAHGLTDALRDAELLTRSLLHTGDAAAYEATRDLLSRPFLDLTTTIASFEWDLTELASLHRALKVATDEETSVLAAFDANSVAA